MIIRSTSNGLFNLFTPLKRLVCSRRVVLIAVVLLLAVVVMRHLLPHSATDAENAAAAPVVTKVGRSGPAHSVPSAATRQIAAPEAPPNAPEASRFAHLFHRAPRVADPWTPDKVPYKGSKEDRTQRTAFSRVFDNPNGTRTFESHLNPIHYQDEQGVWQNIDCNVEPADASAQAQGFALQNNKSSYRSYFAAKASGFHRYELNGQAFEFAMLDASDVPPIVQGESVAYPEAGPGIDLQYTVLSGKLEEDIFLTRYTGQNVFRFALKTPAGVSGRMVESGEVVFADASGQDLCRIPAPFMYDKTWADNHANGIDAGAESREVRLELSQEGELLVLSVIADPLWLADPARVYPVSIDPSYESTRGSGWPHDTCVAEGCGNSNYGSWGYMRTGWRVSPPNPTCRGKWRAMVRFNYPGDMNNTEQACNCRFFMYANGQLGGGFGHNVYRRGINDTWTELGATWNNTGGGSHEGGPGTYVLINGINKWYQWSWSGWGPWLNDTGYVLQCDTENGAVDWSITWWASDGSTSASPYFQMDYDNSVPGLWINSPWRPGGAQIYGNSTTVAVNGQANTAGCRGLGYVQCSRWGYNGNTGWYNINGGGSWSGGYWWWSHSEGGFTGHNRFHFESYGNNTWRSTEWNNTGGSDWFDTYIDNVAPQNPSFSSVTAASTSQINLSWGLPLDQGVGVGAGSDEVSDTTYNGSNYYRRGNVGVYVRADSGGLWGWGGAGSTSHTGLGANTAHSYTIEARDNTGSGRGSWYNYTGQQGSTTRYTLQNAPATPTCGAITVGSIVLNTVNPVNLTAGSSGVYFDSTTAGGDGGINEWVQATTDTATGLSPNTQYTFQAKARNGDSVETGYSGTASKYTLIQDPTGITLSAVSTSQIDATLNGVFANLDMGSSGRNIANTTAGTGSGWSSGSTMTSWSSTGLSPNTSYAFSGQVRNGDATVSATANGSRYTLIQTPAGVSFGAITEDSIEAMPDGTLDNLTSGSSGGKVSNTTAGNDSGWKQDTAGYSSSGLAANTPYSFVARARNAEGVETGDCAPALAWTLSVPPAAGSVTPDNASVCLGDAVTWTAVGGFGVGGVTKYTYAWRQSDTYSWSGLEPEWSGDTIDTIPTAGGTWYLHVKGYNGANVENGTYAYAVTALA
ncbi:MAG TPA: hypothetical protein PLU91_19910, partial [Verrucomicrobiota bacterium]|nr:hypothetical protein [Verrucomicrobiota bacterium]